tara:strand:+ start:740 stop:997 length:258 start_codon:yes stop_codon:yes gene_type:complete
MNTKPKLVDYNLFKKPVEKSIKKIIKKPVLPTKSDNSMLINIVGFLILCIGGLCIYQRYIEREKKELEKQNVILGFHQYVKENIK